MPPVVNFHFLCNNNNCRSFGVRNAHFAWCDRHCVPYEATSRLYTDDAHLLLNFQFFENSNFKIGKEFKYVWPRIRHTFDALLLLINRSSVLTVDFVQRELSLDFAFSTYRSVDTPTPTSNAFERFSESSISFCPFSTWLLLSLRIISKPIQ